MNKLFPITLAAGLMASTAAPAFDTGHHFDATARSMYHLGFGDTPILIATTTNWFVDYYSNAPGTSSAVKAAREDSDKLHFDNLFSTADVDKTWKQFMVNANTMVEAIMNNTSLSDDERTQQMLTTLGMALHAVQDFYTHSNWNTFFPKPSNGYNTQTYLSIGLPPNADTSTILQTGFYPPDRTGQPSTAIGHGSYTEGLNKDSHIRPGWDESQVFAYVESLRFLKIAEGWIKDQDEDFWDYMKDYSSGDLGTVDTTAMQYDAASAFGMSMFVTGSGDADGHYKGNLSGDLTEFGVVSSAFIAHPDSFMVDVVKQVQPQRTLSYCLYDSTCATPTTTYSSSYLPDQQVLQIRVTDVTATSSGIDVGSNPDFYPRVTIGSQGFIDRILEGISDYDNSDYVIDGHKTEAWWFMYFSSASNNTSTDFKIEVWDFDSTSGEDHIDVSSDGDNIDATYTYATGALSGDVSGVHTTIDTAVTSQGGHGDTAKITFYVYHEPLIDPDS